MRVLAGVVTLGAIGSILATSSVNVAFDTLSVELDAGLETVQWVSAGYLLGLATMISATGWLSRRVSPRRLYLWSLGLFAGASILCASAGSIEQLIMFRVLQGMAAGATMPVGQMMLADAAGPHRMGRVMSLVGVPMIMAPVLGPTIGGLLLEQLSWHWIFLMNVPVSLTAFVLGLRFLPRTVTQAAGPFDLRGFVLLSVGAPTLVYGLASAVSIGEFSARAVVPIGIGAALIALFARHAWRAAHPLLDVQLWRNRGFTACALTALLVSCSLFGTLVLLVLYFQLARGEDALVTGLLLMPQGIGMALTLGFAGRLTDRIGGGRVALGGITIVILASAPLVFVGPDTPYWQLWLLLIVRGIGAGGSIMPAMAAVFAMLSREQLPDATPQMNLLQRLGQASGTAILSVILVSQLRAAEPAADDATLAAAFGHTFLFATALAALALVPAAALAMIDGGRSARVAAETARAKAQATSDATIA